MTEYSTPQPWQRRPAVQLAAVLLGVGPMYALAIVQGLASFKSGTLEVPGIRDSLANTLILLSVFGGLQLALLRVLCGESPASLQSGRAPLRQDIAEGIVLAGVLLGAQVLLSLATGGEQLVEVPESNAIIARTLAANPLLLAVWLGPVVWLQAALLEEFGRVFMLSRLWNVWSSPAGRVLSLVGASLLFGMGHVYQGRTGIVGTALIGLLLGGYYLQRRRFMPMLLAHGLYDTVAILGLVALANSGDLPS